MLIQSIEKKMKRAIYSSIAFMVGAIIICAFCFMMCYKMVRDSQKDVFVMVGNMPMLANRTEMESTLEMECRSHIQMFHQYFFNLAPDDDYIKWTNEKAAYLADNSAIKQQVAMRENGFYSQLMSASAVYSIMCDSIKLDMEQMKFRYYGTQIIDRRSRKQLRQLITEGYIKSSKRTANNPHGLLIYNWKTIENKDIKE